MSLICQVLYQFLYHKKMSSIRKLLKRFCYEQIPLSFLKMKSHYDFFTTQQSTDIQQAWVLRPSTETDFLACFEGKKVQHVDHRILQRKILEKLTVTETGHKLRLLQRKSRRERDYENCTKSQTKGICGKTPFFPKLWREVVFLLISLSRCRRRGELIPLIFSSQSSCDRTKFMRSHGVRAISHEE